VHYALRVRTQAFVIEEENLRILFRHHSPHEVAVGRSTDDGETGLFVELAGQDFTEEGRLSGDDDLDPNSPGLTG
jgi:hypothetical protein